MKKLIILVVIAVFYSNLLGQSPENYVTHVNPLIGTQKMGHTFPGATVPFGSVIRLEAPS